MGMHFQVGIITSSFCSVMVGLVRSQGTDPGLKLNVYLVRIFLVQAYNKTGFNAKNLQGRLFNLANVIHFSAELK